MEPLWCGAIERHFIIACLDGLDQSLRLQLVHVFSRHAFNLRIVNHSIDYWKKTKEAIKAIGAIEAAVRSPLICICLIFSLFPTGSHTAIESFEV